ncbi:MAG: hypothetical protein FWC65_00335 [Treponema sp.]|nr:hypothetical protein [Treponema sp.]
MKKSTLQTPRTLGIHVILGVLVMACAVLSGCQSMRNRDIVLPAAGITHEGLAELEEIVIRLDGDGASRADIADARRHAASLEGSAADPAFQALLAAWSGRLFLMEGRVSDAQREHARSQSLLPYNIPAQILAFRLERDVSRRLSMIDLSLQIESARGEILVERGRALFDLNRFFESVAAFDAAFVLLAERPFYEEAYLAFRDKAWELRNLDQGADGRVMEIARQGEMSWRDLIEITRSETDLLRFLTAGREFPAETLFAQLLDRAFIPHTQDTALIQWPHSRPSSAEVVLRSGAAWFLWHINAENRANRGLLTRYSSRFANMPNARSPIPDVNIGSPFIDSILGCVESQFMSLPDGRNFMPYERVRGSEFLLMLRRL